MIVLWYDTVKLYMCIHKRIYFSSLPSLDRGSIAPALSCCFLCASPSAGPSPVLPALAWLVCGCLTGVHTASPVGGCLNCFQSLLSPQHYLEYQAMGWGAGADGPLEAIVIGATKLVVAHSETSGQGRRGVGPFD